MNKKLFLSFATVIVTFSVSSPASAATFTSMINSHHVVAGSTSTATGTATITLEETASVLEYSISLNGLKLNSQGGTLTKVHFHLGEKGIASPFHVFNIYDPIWGNDNDLTITGLDTFNPTFTGKWTDLDVTGLVDTAYLSNPDFTKPLSLYVDELLSDQIYINIHTLDYPTGEIRGQIEVVPEPLTLLGAATAVGMGAVFKRNCKHKKKKEPNTK